MNQEKIGKLIAELRKENNLTQAKLAEKLGITDRAISKWENGRGLPDLSLLKPLCDELKISVNELLSGEKLEKKGNFLDLVEENILNTIDYTNQKIGKIKRSTKTLIFIVFSVVLIFITLFCIDIKRMNEEKPVFFSTWGFKYAPAIDLSEEEIELSIENYLIEKAENEPKHHDNEKSFVAFKTYLIEEKNKELYYVYAWVLEEKYYLEKNEVKQDSGSSIPFKFEVKCINKEYIVTDSVLPRDGSLYAVDMKNIFPRSVRNDMNKVHIDGSIERLSLNIEKQVKLYFHK